MICETQQGLTLDFGDKKTMAELERRMTPSSRHAIHEILASVLEEQSRSSPNFVQVAMKRSQVDDGDEDGDDSDDSSDPATTATTPPPPPPRPVAKEAVQK